MIVKQKIIWLGAVSTLSAIVVVAVLNFSTRQKEERDAIRLCAGEMLMFGTAATLAEGEQKCREHLARIRQTRKLEEP